MTSSPTMHGAAARTTDDRERTRRQIGRLLSPSSIAIVGAGSSPESIGGRAVAALTEGGYAGAILPINPNRAEIAGLPAYPSLLDAPGHIDVAAVLLSSEATPAIVRQAAEKGVGTVVLLNAGFAEAGRADLQEEILGIARDAGMRLVGPNCAGLFNVVGDVRIGFMPAFRLGTFRAGSLALAIQSGGVLTNMLNKAFDLGIGVSTAVSTGNEPDLTWLDMLDFQTHEPQTTAIAVYGEGIPSGDQFIDVLADAQRLGKHIVMLRGGTSEAGMRAAQSHTGAIASSTRVFEAVCRQFGVTLVDELDDLLAVGAYLSRQPGSHSGGTAIITTSGGAAVMSVDALEKRDVPVAVLSEQTKSQLRDILPSFASSDNPIDISAQYLNDPGMFQRTLHAALEAPEVSSVLVSLGMVADRPAEIFADAILAEDAASDKSVVVCWTGGSLTKVGRDRLSLAGQPPFQRLDTCAIALQAAGTTPREPLRRMVDDAGQRLSLGAEGVDEADVAEFLAARGIPVAPYVRVATLPQAISAFAELGPRVVMKLSSPTLKHKSDVGGVIVGIADVEAVEAAFNQLHDIHDRLDLGGFAVLVQSMVTGAVAEMIVGLVRDPHFGWTVALGFGGIHAEVLDDVSLRLAPVSVGGALEMVRELRGSALLAGARNLPLADLQSLAETVSALSRVGSSLGGIDSIELNPVLVLESGAVAVDALAIGGE